TASCAGAWGLPAGPERSASSTSRAIARRTGTSTAASCSAPQLDPVNSQLLVRARSRSRSARRTPQERRLPDREQHECEADEEQQEAGPGGLGGGRRGEQL